MDDNVFNWDRLPRSPAGDGDCLFGCLGCGFGIFVGLLLVALGVKLL